MELQPNYYKDQSRNFPFTETRYCDWYHEVIFDFEGKEYMFTVSLSRSGDTAHSLVQFVEGPLVLKEKINERNQNLFHGHHSLGTYQEIQPAEIEYQLDDAGTYKADDLVEEDRTKNGYIITLNDSRVEYLPNGQKKLTLKSEDLQCNLTFSPRGPAIWYGEGPFEVGPLSPQIKCSGTEELCFAEGTVTYKGHEMKVQKGKGLSEHVWIPGLNFMDYRYGDWTWFHTNEIYGLLYRNEMLDEKGGPYHYDFGGIYIEQDKKLSYFKSCKYTHKKLAWSPEHMRFLPVEQQVVAETEDGVLNVYLKGNIKPPMRPGAFLPDFVSNGIQGWTFTFWSIVYEVTGTFTYNDGRVIQLTPGRGINEPMVVTPIV